MHHKTSKHLKTFSSLLSNHSFIKRRKSSQVLCVEYVCGHIYISKWVVNRYIFTQSQCCNLKALPHIWKPFPVLVSTGSTFPITNSGGTFFLTVPRANTQSFSLPAHVLQIGSSASSLPAADPQPLQTWSISHYTASPPPRRHLVLFQTLQTQQSFSGLHVPATSIPSVPHSFPLPYPPALSMSIPWAAAWLIPDPGPGLQDLASSRCTASGDRPPANCNYFANVMITKMNNEIMLMLKNNDSNDITMTIDHYYYY